MIPSSSQQSLSFSTSGSNQTFYSAASTIPGTAASDSFASSSFSSQSFITNASTEISPTDQFKYNVQGTLDRLANVSILARNALERIEKAYLPDVNPVHTSADIASLRQLLAELSSFLEQTGIGALPVVTLTPEDVDMSQEQWLIQEVSKSVQALYDKRKRIQDNHALVANILSAPESSRK